MQKVGRSWNQQGCAACSCGTVRTGLHLYSALVQQRMGCPLLLGLLAFLGLTVLWVRFKELCSMQLHLLMGWLEWCEASEHGMFAISSCGASTCGFVGTLVKLKGDGRGGVDSFCRADASLSCRPKYG